MAPRQSEAVPVFSHMDSATADTVLKAANRHQYGDLPTVFVSEKGSSGPRLVEDRTISPDKMIMATSDDTVDAVTKNLLECSVDCGREEDWQSVQEKSALAQYEKLAGHLLEAEKKDGDLRRRSKQAIIHLTFTELRITQLEEQLRKLQAELHNKPDDFKINVKRIQLPVYKPFLKRSIEGEFMSTPNSAHILAQDLPSLEVLVTDHSTSRLGPERDTTHISTNIPQQMHQLTPERLRIRYTPLIKMLEQVCRETLSNHQVWPVTGITPTMRKATRGASTVILRPWKFFVAYGNEIRDSVRKVESLVDSARREKSKDGTVTKGIFSEYEYEQEDLLQALKLLIAFLDVELKPTFDLRRAIQGGTATEIEYADLWHLFEVGNTVICSNDRAQAFRVINYTGGRENLIRQLTIEVTTKLAPKTDGFAVDCCSLCFDGTDYVPKLHKFLIRKYKGRRPITSLEVFPLKFDQNWEARHQQFNIQGQEYLDLTRKPFSHQMFRGKTVDEPSQELDAQVIVDTTLAINAEPDWRPTRRVLVDELTSFDARETQMPTTCEHGPYFEGCCGADWVFKDLEMNYTGFKSSDWDHNGLLGPRSAEELTQEDLVLLPKWVHAFVLRSRQWVTVKVADLSEVRFDNNLDELMFSPSHKQTIVALVETHENARTAPAQGAHQGNSVGSALDVVKGKGAGLIILLHGEPGVGKTSTAECVADRTKRPLFPITCGDIGETAMEVEKNLYHNFRLAHKWGCVLLLDEADVFLAKRTKNDLRRNAVTSVFLRSLEYYAGILFLTTNRVGGIDPAFKSRIQLTLYYPRLDREKTRSLYKGFLKRTRKEQERIGVTQFKIEGKEILKFGTDHYRLLKKEGYSTWNGRQIRNAWQTAIALVEHEAALKKEGEPKPVLGKQQFEIVAAGSKEFDRYLMKTLQGGDDEIARRDQWRDDHYHDPDPDVTPLPSLKPAPKPSSSRMPSVMMVTDSEASDGSDDSDESEDEDDLAAGKGKVAARKESNPDTKADADEDGITSADIEKFLRIQALMEKSKKI